MAWRDHTIRATSRGTEESYQRGRSSECPEGNDHRLRPYLLRKRIQDVEPSSEERTRVFSSLANPSKQFPKSGCPQDSVLFCFVLH